jgi:hypothetical protein
MSAPERKQHPACGIAAALLLLTGSQAIAEEGPKASAPLPPPLPAASPETSPPDPEQTQAKPASPKIEFDWPSPKSLQDPALPSHRTARSGAGKEGRHAAGRARSKSDRQVNRSTVASSGPPSSRRPEERQAGRLSPPVDQYSGSPVEGAAIVPPEPPRPSPPYYPGPLPGNGYAYYPYPWPPPAAGPFRQGF